jgi:hypothetical protein
MEAISAQDTTTMTLVDVGCCMGTDVRKLIVDGFEAKVCVTACLECAPRLI